VRRGFRESDPASEEAARAWPVNCFDTDDARRFRRQAWSVTSLLVWGGPCQVGRNAWTRISGLLLAPEHHCDMIPDLEGDAGWVCSNRTGVDPDQL